MPIKPFIKRKMKMEQPDCCAECPLLGLIPKDERPYGSKESHVCIPCQEAMSARGILVRKSKRDSHHPLKRPCDDLWSAWYEAHRSMYPMKREFYIRYRHPFEQSQQMVIKFHR